MFWVGLDVHKKFSRLGLFDPASGELSELGEVRNEELLETVKDLPEPKCLVLEAGRNSHCLAAKLEAVAQAVWIVDPQAVRKLQGQVAKTDRRDAGALAFWAAKEAVAPIWRPDAKTLDLRELTRGRTALVRMTTQVRNMIRSLLARYGYECPYHDLLGTRAQAWLTSVQIPGYAGQRLATLLDLLPILQGKVKALEPTVEREADAHPEAERLQTIPGIGAVLGLSLAVEIGEVSRFSSPVQLRGYSGLYAQVSETAGRRSYGPLSKRGNRWLRYAAVLAAQRISQTRDADPCLKRVYLATAFRHGRNPGKIACARRLLDLAHHLLSQEEEYRRPLSRMQARAA